MTCEKLEAGLQSTLWWALPSKNVLYSAAGENFYDFSLCKGGNMFI